MDVRKTIDNVGKLIDRVNEMTRSDVLVGVPAAKGARKEGSITNAELARIHEFGSPVRNIPARPFLYPGIKRIRPQALAMLKQGAKDALTGTGPSIDVTLNKVGMLARNSVVNEITDPDPPFAPLQPATIRARLRKTAAGRRQLRKYKGNRQGMMEWASGGNVKPLIDTGQLRASISYVVRKGGA
jgi:hypothetical protein